MAGQEANLKNKCDAREENSNSNSLSRLPEGRAVRGLRVPRDKGMKVWDGS